LKKTVNIIIILFLISLGWKGYAQDLPTACGGSFVTYGVYGDNGNSVFEWEIVEEGVGRIHRFYNDSVTIEWFNEAATATLRVTETNFLGCEGEPYEQIVLVTTPDIDIGLDEEICEGESHEFYASASDISTYLWQDGSDGETFIATSSGQYWVRVTDENGCRNTDTANLVVHALPEVDLGADTALCGEDELILDAYSDDAVFYEWWTADGISSVTTSTFQVYPQTRDQEIWVNVSNEYNCVGTDSITVNFCGDLEIPNAFTPNDDGDNDEWVIEQLFSFGEEVTIDVYNRWGERVYHADGYSASDYWDGTDQRGKKLPMDSYYYVIDLHNGEEPIVGTVTIIR